MTMDKFSINFLSDWKRPLRLSGFTVIGFDFDWGFPDSDIHPWVSVALRFMGFHLDVTYWPRGKYA